MPELKKVVAVQDDSSHWYVIPSEKQELFHSLINRIGDDSDNWESEDLFQETFGDYMTGGDLNNIQLYAEI